MEELKEFSWKEFLEEEAAEEELTQVLNRVEQAVTQTAEVQTDQEKKERRMKRVVVDVLEQLRNRAIGGRCPQGKGYEAGRT